MGSELTLTVLKALSLLLNIIMLGIVTRALLSWLPLSKGNRFVRLIYQITEPILAPIRGLMGNTSFGKNSMIDLSPMIALLIIYILLGIIGRTV